MNPVNFNPNIAHIRDSENVFQILNTEETDWDAEATQVIYEAWKATQI